MKTDSPQTALQESLQNYRAAPDIAGIKVVFVNVFFVGTPGKWFLVDAGLPGYGQKIVSAAKELYGAHAKPAGIILTHGHFDHVGALDYLLKVWDVPVYAHLLEHPYLTGKSSYPPPDPAIGGGAMSYMSWVFPIKPIDISDNLHQLHEGESLKDFPEWTVYHTPGHSPGHVSLFRKNDRALIAGDAFVTVNQNSALAVISQKQKLHGPPAYFTCDWEAARDSVQFLDTLHPSVAACGHGIPMGGLQLNKLLHELSENFDSLAIPSNGRYVKQSAFTDENGILDMPPPISFYVARSLGIFTLLSLVGFGLYKAFNKSNK